MKTDALNNALKKCVEMLVGRQFDEIAVNGMNGRLSIEEIQTALVDYPGTPTMPDSNAWEHYRLYSPQPNGWSILEFELWYDGKESDLTLSARTRTSQDGVVEFEIMDIHVQ